jgi:hypothetical protein
MRSPRRSRTRRSDGNRRRLAGVDEGVRAGLLVLLLAAGSASVAAAVPPESDRVYTASLAYAKCMRAHGVPQPDPDRNGDIHLTAADERRMRRVGRAKIQAADKLCFNLHLKGVVSTKPLSIAAQLQAMRVLEDLSGCMRGYGYRMGKPVVRNLSRGRAFFGFDRPALGIRDRARFARSQHTCERRVAMARRIDAIIRADRGPY